MSFRLCLRLGILFMVLSALSPTAYADSWLPPKPESTYESAAQDAHFIVTATAHPGALLASSGAVYTKQPGTASADWIKRWEAPLQNLPVTALIANGGWRVITFDSWYSAGFGDEAIVFYDETGTLLKKHSLESLLSEPELNKVPHSVSSRWWRTKASIDETLGLLKVEIAQSQDKQRSTKPLVFDLLNGEVIMP